LGGEIPHPHPLNAYIVKHIYEKPRKRDKVFSDLEFRNLDFRLLLFKILKIRKSRIWNSEIQIPKFQIRKPFNPICEGELLAQEVGVVEIEGNRFLVRLRVFLYEGGAPPLLPPLFPPQLPLPPPPHPFAQLAGTTSIWDQRDRTTHTQ
jgi:hypothetical protein